MEKPNYIKSQIIPYGCGPIAVLNAYKSVGIDVPFQWMRESFERWGFKNKTGIGSKFVRAALTAFGINFFEVKNPNVETIERFLDTGCTVLVSYVWKMPELRPGKKMGGHIIFIDGHEGAFFNAYNVNGNGAENKRVLAEYLKLGQARLWVIDGLNY